MNFNSILAIYDTKQVDMLKKQFMDQLYEKIREEKDYCARTGETPRMSDQTYAEIQRMLGKCGNAFQVNALEYFVFSKMEVPTWQDVEMKGWEDSNDALKT